MAKKSEFWKDGIQFECQGSGNCCVSRGGYGFVFLTKEDRQSMAEALNISTVAFTKQFCVQEDGIWRLKDGVSDDCVFLLENRCTVYKGRPTQCRTWPFWPETLNTRTWSKEVASFCPGVGKGKVWSAAEVEEQLNMQIKSESLHGT